MPLPEIVRRTTAAPARIMGYEGTVGTLKPGANADVAVFGLREGSFELKDSDGDVVTAKRRLLCQTTIKERTGAGTNGRQKGRRSPKGSGCHSAALRPVNDSEENQGFPPKPPFLKGFAP